MTDLNYYGREKISRILLQVAPPVMTAQLIQALYNIVDSLFVGHYSSDGLTALSIIYPMQLLLIALGVGIGVGINTRIAQFLGADDEGGARNTASLAAPLGIVLWAATAVICFFIMPFYAEMSTSSEAVIEDVIVYGRIVCVGGIGLFTESCFSKVLQAYGDMKTPMAAQICGAVTNIVLDPVLIFGLGPFPEMGVGGAAVATVAGQIFAAVVVGRKAFVRSRGLRRNIHEVRMIYALGIPNIVMQSAYTFYILGLNLILEGFSDQAVTALGLYYKWQTFFFIPLGALQTCIVPIVSYNFTAGNTARCRETMRVSFLAGTCLMGIGTLCFEIIPQQMLAFFTDNSQVISIGSYGFRLIGLSFIPMVTSLLFPVFFQAIGAGVRSTMLTLLRTVFLFVPLGYIFAAFSLHTFWLTFIVTETVTSIFGLIFYRHFVKEKCIKGTAVKSLT